MRLFIAINFNNATISNLIALRDQLRTNSKHGNFSLPENLHLTLAFLGECNTKQIDVIKAVMDSVDFQPFNLMIERVGRFKRDSSDIWWAGVQDSKALLDLQNVLTDRLITAGFTLDKRKYSPHITLGRKVLTDSIPYRIELFGEVVSSIELMKSEHINGKLTYTSIYLKEALK